MVFGLFRLAKYFEILLNDLLERWGLGQAKRHSSCTTHRSWPSIDDGLDARVEGICHLAKRQVFLLGQFAQGLPGHGWGDLVSRQSVGAVIAQAILRHMSAL